ncbi:hypothetical protein BD408DRAFT_426684, partial [Parasitella parasitica]
MDFEYAVNTKLLPEYLVVTAASFYMYQRERFGWSGPASKSPKRFLVNEGGIMFTVFAAFSGDGILKVALKTHLKKGRKSINVYLQFLGELLVSLEKTQVNLVLDSNFHKQLASGDQEMLV